ncbi:hypothetical protein [Amycolatopsis sp. NPDC059021]|uniref:hypothetical protein n=1 Tax=Amycolatopsis sp. NPDC059021 TaxID=3346704 RepID=UPI0036731545
MKYLLNSALAVGIATAVVTPVVTLAQPAVAMAQPTAEPDWWEVYSIGGNSASA